MTKSTLESLFSLFTVLALLLPSPVPAPKSSDVCLLKKERTISLLSYKYEIRNHLGSGAFGTVYEVLEEGKKHLQAIKLFHMQSNRHCISTVMQLGPSLQFRESTLPSYLSLLSSPKNHYFVSISQRLSDQSIMPAYVIMELLPKRFYTSIPLMPSTEYFSLLQYHIFFQLFDAYSIFLKQHPYPILHRDFHFGNILFHLRTWNIKVFDYSIAEFCDEKYCSGKDIRRVGIWFLLSGMYSGGTVSLLESFMKKVPETTEKLNDIHTSLSPLLSPLSRGTEPVSLWSMIQKEILKNTSHEEILSYLIQHQENPSRPPLSSPSSLSSSSSPSEHPEWFTQAKEALLNNPNLSPKQLAQVFPAQQHALDILETLLSFSLLKDIKSFLSFAHFSLSLSSLLQNFHLDKLIQESSPEEIKILQVTLQGKLDIPWERYNFETRYLDERLDDTREMKERRERRDWLQTSLLSSLQLTQWNFYIPLPEEQFFLWQMLRVARFMDLISSSNRGNSPCIVHGLSVLLCEKSPDWISAYVLIFLMNVSRATLGRREQMLLCRLGSEGEIFPEEDFWISVYQLPKRKGREGLVRERARRLFARLEIVAPEGCFEGGERREEGREERENRESEKKEEEREVEATEEGEEGEAEKTEEGEQSSIDEESREKVRRERKEEEKEERRKEREEGENADFIDFEMEEHVLSYHGHTRKDSLRMMEEVAAEFHRREELEEREREGEKETGEIDFTEEEMRMIWQKFYHSNLFLQDEGNEILTGRELSKILSCILAESTVSRLTFKFAVSYLKLHQKILSPIPSKTQSTSPIIGYIAPVKNCFAPDLHQFFEPTLDIFDEKLSVDTIHQILSNASP